jgi:hypothetical protein
MYLQVVELTVGRDSNPHIVAGAIAAKVAVAGCACIPPASWVMTTSMQLLPVQQSTTAGS